MKMQKNIEMNSLNEELKRRDQQKEQLNSDNSQSGMVALDDTQRVKVLSPGRIIFKRFFKNKLAIIGLAILITMFVFSFLGPFAYPFSQTQIFYKYDYLNINYASASERTEAVIYKVGDSRELSSTVVNSINSYITTMTGQGNTEMVVTDKDGSQYILQELGDEVYTVTADDLTPVAMYYDNAVIGEYNKITKKLTGSAQVLSEPEFSELVAGAADKNASTFSYNEIDFKIETYAKNQYRISRMSSEIEYMGEELGEDFAAVAARNLEGTSFQYSGAAYRASAGADGAYTISAIGDKTVVLVASRFVFNPTQIGSDFSEAFKANSLLALYSRDTFTENGKEYTIIQDKDGFTINDAAGAEIASVGTFVVRRYTGQDTLSLDFKEIAQEEIAKMKASNSLTGSFVYSLPEIDKNGDFVKDENGDFTYADTDINIINKGKEYVLTCEQITYLIDIFSAPTSEHIFGTDGDGMDIFARMMYGGRISLMVGFVVVLLETILGVILGGVAGFFGGWVDTLIMRLVDIFYCIPSMPILIIMGAFFDVIKMTPYERLIWLMIILGILGWASVARLVRGQILSLREQEFMVAQEATGMKAQKRIFRHLIPNVMPQLIVNATMGLGSVIITESTLSFLGLGVKHPLATWGTMINSVTNSAESMVKYTYIWLPVGMLICLTVVAFNFVGDGLRDAFDPKMKQ